MTWPREEKRETKRNLYVRPVGYKPMGGLSGDGELLDISNGGARIRTAARLPQRGTMIQAWIPLSGLETAVPVLGLVRWMKRERRQIYQFGFQFLF
jgi:PilZ domain